MAQTSPEKISWVTLALMIVAAVASIRALPGMAIYGLGSILLYLLPALLFFLPAALVTTELGTTWRGGIYGWVRQAYGDRAAFFSAWYLWLQVAMLLPVVLAFGADTLAYLIDPRLAGNGIFTACVITLLVWSITLMALRGVGALARLSSLFMLLGTLLPALLLMVLGAWWLLRGQPSASPLDWHALLPHVFSHDSSVLAGHGKTHTGIWQRFDGELSGLVLIVSNFLAYAGIEINAVYARNLPNPQRDMPRSLILSVILILLIFIPPTLAIALVVPSDKISLTVGVMQAYSDFFNALGVGYLTPVMALFLIIGVLGGVLTWIAGACKEIQYVGKAGLLPPWWQQTNRHDMPANVMLLLAALVSLLSLIYVLVPDVSAAFWMLSALAAQMYLVIYLLMFMAAIRLRQSQPATPRGYTLARLPLVAGIGMLSSLLALLLGLLPPSGETFPLSSGHYMLLLASGLVLAALPPFVFSALRKAHWQQVSDEEAASYSAPLTISPAGAHGPSRHDE
ncbi:amino acid permease [Craterilacuibacter sp. RT1T]|uniref:amino acid permease n=1 Tax=Craterilacuibacter sp. RT1T TaxID=2942211 RepID=UPI0020C14378|nr:amino acid permease [Craterilacuibacter sp. RT1T]MCL6262311.1 APC family permease [Craterilacuibacter sp. RT1T]